MPRTTSTDSRAKTASSIAEARAKHTPIMHNLGRAIEPNEPDPSLMKRNVLSVDPGLQGTGAAFFKKGFLWDATTLEVPSRYRMWDWPVRADYLVNLLLDWSGVRNTILPDLVTVVVEYPGFQGGAARQMGWQTGDLQKLTYLVGLMSGRFYRCDFWPVPVPMWKGQLPKSVTEERIKKRLTKEEALNPISNHAWDAVGIGLWAMGRF